MEDMKQSAGILLYRLRDSGLEVLLVHPGGPYWMKKDHGVWSIPKGEILEDEEPLTAARREFKEELGMPAEGRFMPLGSVTQRKDKIVHVWATEGDLDVSQIRSSMFSMVWPPNSGVLREFPEVDRAAWFSIAEARRRILTGQRVFLDELARRVPSGFRVSAR
jgi:predicted NUDIX family NTP pyrophosphohydrolase